MRVCAGSSPHCVATQLSYEIKSMRNKGRLEFYLPRTGLGARKGACCFHQNAVQRQTRSRFLNHRCAFVSCNPAERNIPAQIHKWHCFRQAVREAMEHTARPGFFYDGKSICDRLSAGRIKLWLSRRCTITGTSSSRAAMRCLRNESF